MPGVWFALRKSLQCKSKLSGFHDLDSSGTVHYPIQRKMPRRRSASVGCLANLKEVIHGPKKNNRKPSICSPKLVVDNRAENPNPASANEMVHDLRTPLKTTCPVLKRSGHFRSMSVGDFRRSSSENSTKYHGCLTLPVCQTCGLQHKRSDAIKEPHPLSEHDAIKEPHRLSEHGVSELVEGDSSRKIVEIICQARPENSSYNVDDTEDTKIERILKVHNMENILTWFEEYREMVKTKASKQSNNYNPRCLADGNELLMFYATTVSCLLGTDGSSSLCESIHCGACTILKNGFFTWRDFVGRMGIFATCDSESALRYARNQEGQSKRKKALFVCRVIAGQIHSPLKKIEQGLGAYSGFDSLAWKVGQNKIAEELVLLNPRALLPCFVAIYKI